MRMSRPIIVNTNSHMQVKVVQQVSDCLLNVRQQEILITEIYRGLTMKE